MNRNSTPISSPNYTHTQRKITNKSRLEDLLKRAFDILLSALGLTLASPMFLWVAWRIKRDSQGPVYFRGSRAGRFGKTFTILKFRTMYEIPESFNGPRVTAQDDPRITPLGKWLRATKLNELPQLWNVFKGEMSLVGPRPEDPEIVSGWSDELRHELLSVRPGITSPASVLYRDEENLLETSDVMVTYFKDILPSKLRLDQLYVRHHSFWGDLDIIFYTILILFRLYKQSSPHDEHLFTSPVTNIFRRHVSWFIGDLLITITVIGITGLFWRSFGPLNVGWRVAVLMALSFAVLFSVTNALMGVNRVRWSRASAADAIDLIPGVFLAMILAVVFNYFYPVSVLRLLYGNEIPDWLPHRPLLDFGLIVIASALAFIGFVFVRFRSRLVTGLASRWVDWRRVVNPAQERALIIGGGETGLFASFMFSSGRYQNIFDIVGFIDDDLYKLDTRIHGLHVIGRCSDIPKIVTQYDIGIILFAIHNITSASRRKILDICASTSAHTVFFPDFPATLNDIVHRNGLPIQETIPFESLDIKRSILAKDLPCYMCLTRLSPPQTIVWLNQIELSAKQGDIETVLAYIQDLRNLVGGDVSELEPSESQIQQEY
ncbi:sugar transferase [Chloroflexota bacterium]